MERGLFITFEGLDGSSKTTQAKLLSEWMEERGIQHILTKEPGAEHIPECCKMRKILLDPKNSITPTAELLLFLADRAQHVEKCVAPALQQGTHVICDRFIDSTTVIQSSRGLSRIKIDELNAFATSNLSPDITFILDIPVEVGLERARKKSIYKQGDRMEMENLRFHEAVRNGFLKLANSIMDNRFRLVDASPPKTSEEINEEIVNHIKMELWG